MLILNCDNRVGKHHVMAEKVRVFFSFVDEMPRLGSSLLVKHTTVLRQECFFNYSSSFRWDMRHFCQIYLEEMIPTKKYFGGSDSWTAGRGFKTSCCLRKFSVTDCHAVTYLKTCIEKKGALEKFLGPNPVKYFSISIKSAQEFTGELIGWKLPRSLKQPIKTLKLQLRVNWSWQCSLSWYKA